MGVGLRRVDKGCVGAVGSAVGGTVDDRFEAAEGGKGVVRFSGGGIVDFLDDVGTVEGGDGVPRFSDGGAKNPDLRDDDGMSVERATAPSSSGLSNVSALRVSAAGIVVELRRDEPRAPLCGSGPSGGVFPIVTTSTLVEFLQRVIRSRHESSFFHCSEIITLRQSAALRNQSIEITCRFGILCS